METIKKEFKGTKGEWVVCGETKIMVLSDSGAYRPNAMHCSLSTQEELEANAKLIAAAPDLLEALQIALPYLEHFCMDMTPLIAKQAIEKAL